MMMLTPDELQADIYQTSIAPNIRDGAALLFAHGLNVHFNLIEPEDDVDVDHGRAEGSRPHGARRIPEGRRRALPDRRPPGRHAAMPMTSRSPMPRRSAAAAPASSRPTSARNARPTCSASRSVLCGGLVELIRAGFETLVEAGYAPGDGLFRVPARGEADRRPDLRGRHRQHELLDLQHRRVRRVRHRARASSPPRPRPR